MESGCLGPIAASQLAFYCSLFLVSRFQVGQLPFLHGVSSGWLSWTCTTGTACTPSFPSCGRCRDQFSLLCIPVPVLDFPHQDPPHLGSSPPFPHVVSLQAGGCGRKSVQSWVGVVKVGVVWLFFAPNGSEQVYLPMGYCYARRLSAEPSTLIQELREVRERVSFYVVN